MHGLTSHTIYHRCKETVNVFEWLGATTVVTGNSQKFLYCNCTSDIDTLHIASIIQHLFDGATLIFHSQYAGKTRSMSCMAEAVCLNACMFNN